VALPWKRRAAPTAVAPPTPYDRWMKLAHAACLGLAVLLLALSIIPAILDAASANDGADINITTEFYTAGDGGGGYVTWDFNGRAASAFRARIDAAGNGDGNVSDQELANFAGGVDSTFERQVLVFRHFEILAVRIFELRGISTVPVNDSAPAHLKMVINGHWLDQEGDITQANDAALHVVYGNLSGWETVRERTLTISGAGSTFTPIFTHARVLRVPGGSLVVDVQNYGSGSSETGSEAALHFARFNPSDSSFVLLVPLAIAYFLGIRAPRREQEASGHRRIAPLHNALSAAFLLLIAAYFAGVYGLGIWAGGIALGVAGMLLSYKLYPAGQVPAQWAPVELPPDEPALDSLAAGTDPALWTSAQAPSNEPTAPRLESSRPLERPQEAWRAPPPVPASPASARPAAPQGPAPRAAAPAAATTTIRCPACKHQFEAQGQRPISITCPHCGRRGVLR
jgi:hypothetical protein